MGSPRSGARLAAVVTIAALLIGALTGCGRTTPTPTQPTAPGIQPNPTGTLPIANEKASLRVILLRDERIASYVYGENAFTTWLEDRTGVQVEFILYPENLGMYSPEWMFSGSDIYLGPIDRCLADHYGAEGQLLPLESLIGRYAGNLSAQEERIPWLRSAVTAPDGHVYALPLAVQDDVLDPDTIGMRMWIHQGFLDAYGGSMPATTEELRAFLLWVRDADANGNGDPADEIGWSGSEKTSVLYARPTEFLMNAFSLQDRDGYAIRNGAVRCALIEDNYRDGLRYLNGLMEAGLMDTEYPSHDGNSLRARIEQNGGDTVACVSACRLSSLSDDPVVQAKYVCLPPLAGPDGQARTYGDPFAGVRYDARFLNPDATGSYRTRGSAAAMISPECADPGLAMAWLDALYDPEVLLRASFGEPGADWQSPAAGTVAADGGPTRAEILRDRWMAQSSGFWGESFPLLFQGSTTSQVLLPAAADPALAAECAAARVYEPYAVPCALPPFALDRDTQVQVNEWRTNIGDYNRSAVTDFIYGNLDIDDDAVWTNYTEAIRALGLDEYLATMQAAYDRDWRDVYPEVYTPVPTRTE